MKFTRPLSTIPKNKLEHALIGTGFTLILVAIPLLPVLGKFIALVAFAYVIEISQKVFGWGKFEHLDAVAVVIGGVPVLVAYFIAKGALCPSLP